MLRKYGCILLFFLFLFAFSSAVTASEITVVVDNEVVEFERPPIQESGKLLVPMREIFTAMGASVSWDEAEKTATGVLNDITVSIPIGSYLPTVNDVPVAIDVPAMFINSRTYLPLRFIVEALGGRVKWEATTNTAVITSAGIKTTGKEGRAKTDINSASLEDLLEIEGLDQTAASEIISCRDTNGLFLSFEEIRALPSMTDVLFNILLNNTRIVYREEGVACWYGDKFHGRMTSSGELYDKNLHTAAHRTLPFGTIVNVYFPETGRDAWVRINDRGPHKPGRIIDLSHGAADAIGLTPYGLGKVELEVIIEE